ncbi:hypothetical protein PS662_04257 [Pseudomonas fluorescens]|uniref:DUF3077 domain-containing protein n=1 Tax=Pseudomonas fluorescens TaxID=294 RepID=A0A5E6VWH8_PSEFL|nr:DUF3077 domain-containing protein [Pseudomonas fluorescens]VVN18989.1 hypothetical protein PS662_04257 [Pseudomonas fluorescens]
MTLPNLELLDLQIDTSLTSPKGSAAAQRALDYYLKPTVSDEAEEERFFEVNRKVSSEEALVRATELLRCAAATAYESASHLHGSHRDLAFSTVHMIDMAKALLDRSLDGGQHA